MSKKIVFMMTLFLMIVLYNGCGKEGTDNKDFGTDSTPLQVEELSSSVNNESDNIEKNNIEQNVIDSNDSKPINTESNNFARDDNGELDYNYDYNEDIKADIENVVSESSSLQEELASIDEIIQKYTPLAEAAVTQYEMNVSSGWFFIIWDTELNNLWSRFSDSADQQIKEVILTEQRNWIAMKDEATILSIGPSEDGGSIYPLLQNSVLEEFTKNRVYYLANELAKIKGESFVLPELSEKYGVFVDNQGTGSIYSSLVTRQGIQGNDEVAISIYRQGEIEGSFSDKGNGELVFTSDDSNVKGIIVIKGWNGASFEVTEVKGESTFSVGEKFEFPLIY